MRHFLMTFFYFFDVMCFTYKEILAQHLSRKMFPVWGLLYPHLRDMHKLLDMHILPDTRL